MITFTVLGFASQFIARVALRKRHGPLVWFIRQCADFLLGICPTLLGVTILSEVFIHLIGSDPFYTAVFALLMTLFIGIFGLYNARYPKVIVVPLTNSRLSEPIRFVQISDVHIGSRSGQFLARVINQVEQCDADFLCITGDFIDQHGVSEATLKPLTELNIPIYFSTGNHEFYEDFDAIMQRLNNLGVQVLRNQVIQQHNIEIIGVDDSSNTSHLKNQLQKLTLTADKFKLLMFHRPQGLKDAAASGIDLKISGHTHDGQIWPFNWLVKTQFKYLKGLHQLGNTYLYVNQGTGTWGPTMRIGTQCEITLFELTPS